MLRALDQSIREGHYARKQLLCSDRLIAWSHRCRFEVGVRLARQFAGKRILDYGCGDGTFLGLLAADPARPATAVGAELRASLVRDCEARLGGRPGLSFVLIDQLDEPGHQGTYDAVFCMEVLEHVVTLDPVLARLERLLAPSGKLLISVPVETGLPLTVKQTIRRVAGWRRLGDYSGMASYAFGEYLAGLFAGCRQHMLRPVRRDVDGNCFHDHKGFNWRSLRAALRQRFEIERSLSSPIGWLPPDLASQVWFLARKKSVLAAHPACEISRPVS